jgi:DNA invertase Pin-like site-specific DNA recombinase
MANEKYVGYYRVSTQRQGRSGLGLEAQRDAVQALVARSGGRLLEEYTEVESGKRSDRPELQRAIRRAKVSGARLIIAKLDRLSRNASFLLALRDSGVLFVAADMPDTNETVVGFMAIIADHERKMIAQRTREALAVARKRLAKQGRKLGNPNGASALRRAGKGNAAAIAAVMTQAAKRAEELRETLVDVINGGAASLAAVAAELNEREIEAPRGGRWHPMTVARLRDRFGG